jgi:hypothetical protein
LLSGNIAAGDKVMRMHAQTATALCIAREGAVACPLPARDDAIPRGKHDDQVDSTAQLLDWFKRPMMSNQGILELYRRLAEEARGERATADPPVRLRAPRGTSHIGLLSGGVRAVAADGTVEMTEEDAEPLLRAGWLRVDPVNPAATGRGGLR